MNAKQRMHPSAAPETLPVAHSQVLLDVLRALGAYRNPAVLFRELGNILRGVAEVDSVAVILYDEPTHKMQLYALETFESPAPLPKHSLEPEETTLWHAYQRQEPIVIPFVAEETRFPKMMEMLSEAGLQSHCIFPLTTAHRRLGAFGISSQKPDAYAEDIVRLLQLVADQVALAVGDALNLESSQMTCRRLQLILDLNNSVASNLELKQLLRSLSASIRQVMNCDLAGVALPDESGKNLLISGLDFPQSHGFFQEDNVVGMEGSLLGQVFRNREIYVAGEDELFAECEGKNPEELKSFCAVPLISRDRTLGLLLLARRQDDVFSADDIEFLKQLATQVAIAVENARAYGQIAHLKEQLSQEKVYLEDEIRSEMNFQEIVGTSSAIRHVLRDVETVAGSDSTVLILGETGTGKELIARAIHDLSARRKNAFVKLNCAAIPTGLLESELFGHEKGAFTGAISRHVGRFELAHQGTVFLDEIGDIPLELQPKLLRVLQEREFERLGSTRTMKSDARLIAATNRNLDQMVQDHKFRADLFYRLNVFPIQLPALRERREDIPALVRHFVQQFSRRMNKLIETIPSATMEALTAYDWPGNIRELQNVIERAVILSPGPVLKVAIADLKVRVIAVPTNGHTHIRGVLEQTERNEIITALNESGWTVAGPGGAAAKLGLKRSTLQFRMQKLGITKMEHAS